ncbi:MAG: DUF1592 domain-containing protein [Acidobacteriota bacterium]
MKHAVTMLFSAVLLVAAFPTAPTYASRPQGSGQGTPAREALPTASHESLITTYCVTCHNDARKTGGLSLATFDVSQPEQTPAVSEKVIRKLTLGMMPPAGARRPAAATLKELVTALETRIDAAAARNPNPGWRPFQRLTRTEYARAVRELLDLDVDVTAFLPADTVSHGFDNIADVQGFSPALFEGYLRAARQVSRLALGDPAASPTSATYTVPTFESQLRHVEGTPFGARGGVAVEHVFPADGTYVFKVVLVRTVSGELFGNTAIAVTGRNEPLDILINGDRVAVLEVHSGMSEADEKPMTVETPPIHVKAGPQRIAATFRQHFAGPVDDLMAPIDHSLIDTRIGTGFGITTGPHVRDLTIAGPLQVTGISETPSRRRVFTCRPTRASEETTCAQQIIRRLASQAYRGPVSAPDFDDLMRFYAEGRKGGDFESGVRLAVQGMLAHPRFVFRAERVPTGLETSPSHLVSDVELASRLSFFLWGTVPDAELVKVAMQGTLGTQAGLERQVRRMVADRRADALSQRFAAQWLRLQDVDKIRPDGLRYPYWDRSLSDAFRRETELFFDSLVREDRSVLELLTADYSFANERLARHYGIPNVTGTEFRRVTLPETRRGILGQGSFLLSTSVADRTSPVQRGKWVMQVLLGSPPPPPPPNVPLLEETRAAEGSRTLSVRERMEEHRRNPACTSCHRVIDPLGLALENFDVTGRWRDHDGGLPVDASGELYDGRRIDGPAGLREALLAYQDALLLTFTENLMTYALGRHVEHYDMPAIRGIIRNARANGHRTSAYILGVVESRAFRMSRPSLSETTVVGAP